MINFFGLKISNWSICLLLGDIFAYCLALPFGIIMEGMDFQFFFNQFQVPLVMMGLTYILILYIANLYNHYEDFRRRDNISRVILSCLIGTIIVFGNFRFRHILPLKFIEWHAVAFVWLTVIWRFSFSSLALTTKLKRHALILGAGRAGRWIADAIKKQPYCGLSVKGFIDDDPEKQGTMIDDLPVLGATDELENLVRQEKIGLVVVAITYTKSAPLLIAINRIFMSGYHVVDIPSLYEFLAGKIPVDHISDMWLYFKQMDYQRVYYPNLKRLGDLIMASVGLLLSWPLFIIIALSIRLDSPGSIFFRQQRLGQNNKPFLIFKFRTMTTVVSDAASPQWATSNDQRVTRTGRLLRKMHLDELPQLINILKGEMSLIGPRAEWDVFAQKPQEVVAEWRPGRRHTDLPGSKVLVGHREQIPYYSYRLLVKPGVTGWAQVMFPRAGSSMEEMKEKLQYDLYYIKNCGVLLDLAILMKTIRIVVLGHGK